MRRKQKTRSLLDIVSLPKTFSYEIDAPLETVVQELAALEEDAQMFRRASQEVSVLPTAEGYVFRLRRRRHGTLTVSAEGQVWQDETGCVIVEGETRLNGWNALIPLIVVSLIGLGVVLLTMPAVSRGVLFMPFFLSMLLGIFTTFSVYWGDRQKLISTLDEAITNLQTRGDTKAKRHPSLELDETGSYDEESSPRLQSQEKRR